MPGGNTSLTTLDTRRRLLVAEAELHRAQASEDWAEVGRSIHKIKDYTTTARTLINVAGIVVAGVSGLQQMRRDRKPLSSQLLTGAVLASSLWFALRPRTPEETNGGQ